MAQDNRVFKLDALDQAVLNQANLQFDNGVLMRELIVTQILLRNKDKNLQYDPTSKQFYEVVEIDKNKIEAVSPIR